MVVLGGLRAVQDTLGYLQSSETFDVDKVTSGLHLDVVHGSRHILELAQSLTKRKPMRDWGHMQWPNVDCCHLLEADLKGNVNFSRLYKPTSQVSRRMASSHRCGKPDVDSTF